MMLVKFAEGMIEAVGKPVLKGSMDDYYGSWMHDMSSRHDITSDKLWVTRKNDTSYIFEYKTKEHFKNRTARPIKLQYAFQVEKIRIKQQGISNYIYTSYNCSL